MHTALQRRFRRVYRTRDNGNHIDAVTLCYAYLLKRKTGGKKSITRLFGIGIYAQQVVSLLAVMVVALLLVYLNAIVARIKENG